MKNVLMICYYYPPLITSGTIRSLEFSKNLKKLGWNIRVLTVKKSRDRYVKIGGLIPNNIDIYGAYEFNLEGICYFFHKHIYKRLKSLGIKLKKNYFEEIFCIPDPRIGWISFFKTLKLAKKSDIIYVSCSPFSSSIIGAFVKKLTKKPLVCDFRDAWTLNPYIDHIRFHKWISEKMERFVLNSTDYLIVTSNGTEKLYQKKYPKLKVRTIFNGYDKLIKSNFKNKKFTIMHVGAFYYKTRTPDLLFKALKELDIDFEFVSVGSNIDDYAKKYGISDKVVSINRVPREIIFAYLKKASLLYLKQGREKRKKINYIAIAAKTYDYLATGIPILADIPEGDNADIIKKYSKNSYIITSNNVEDIKKAILDVYNKWKKEKLTKKIKKEFIKKFNRMNLTKELMGVFNDILWNNKCFKKY